MVNKSCFTILMWIYTPNVQRSTFNFCLQIQTIMEIISVDFYKIYHASLSDEAIVLLFRKRFHDEEK